MPVSTLPCLPVLEGRPCMHVTQRSLKLMPKCYNLCKQHAVFVHPYKQQNMLIPQLASCYWFCLGTTSTVFWTCSVSQVCSASGQSSDTQLEDEQWGVISISQPAAAAAVSVYGTTAGLDCACYTTSGITCSVFCIQIVSTMATTSLEDVAKASKGSPLLIFQLYTQRDRDFTASLIRSKTHFVVG